MAYRFKLWVFVFEILPEANKHLSFCLKYVIDFESQVIIGYRDRVKSVTRSSCRSCRVNDMRKCIGIVFYKRELKIILSFAISKRAQQFSTLEIARV